MAKTEQEHYNILSVFLFNLIQFQTHDLMFKEPIVTSLFSNKTPGPAARTTSAKISGATGPVSGCPGTWAQATVGSNNFQQNNKWVEQKVPEVFWTFWVSFGKSACIWIFLSILDAKFWWPFWKVPSRGPPAPNCFQSPTPGCFGRCFFCFVFW